MKPLLRFVILAGGAALAGCVSSPYQHIVTQDGREYHCRPGDNHNITCYNRQRFFAKMQAGAGGPADRDYQYLEGAAKPLPPSAGEMYGPQILNAPPGVSR